ncbi:MAG: beta-galactosidase [Roseburia sp.]|nr:beta-galactosidase [Roseburia sp.]MCM1099604.1 beta-galactosidase [Ruminococcus flavefaciens]
MKEVMHMSGNFEIKDTFYLNGKPFQILSGSIHYFRVVPQYWRDRLEKLKAMGLNTVETYIPWNVHEPKKGEFCFEGMADVVGFVRLAQELGLYVILRPSPYICAEWEFGGLPGWLLAEDGMEVRSSSPLFLRHVREYYNVLLPILKPLQLTEGGNVILMQVENEYGYFADDASYPETLKRMLREGGINVPFITSDEPKAESILGGRVEGALPTGNFGSRTKERFSILKEFTGGGPLMCAEFWVGWFDHWGNGGHMTGNLEQSVKDLEDMIRLGHVNIYMFVGGTNFGFMNGSNYYDELTPDVTSYDYDAVLTEAGDLTEKFYRYREILGKYRELPELTVNAVGKKKAYGRVTVQERVGLLQTLSALAAPVESRQPRSMERLGQNYGYILYTSPIRNERKLEKLRLWDANDRANVFLGEKRLLNLYDRELSEEHKLDQETAEGEELAILVENMGRVNFGPRMNRQRKGIDGCVQLNGHMHTGWRQYTLPLDNLSRVDYSAGYTAGMPAFYRFRLEVEEPCDTFLELEGWGKGCVFLNGFHLGRFWEIGPQRRLYVPGPLLKKGGNEIVVFETEGKATGEICFWDAPDIG